MLSEQPFVEEITYRDIERFWERSSERLWCGDYRVWISPNGLLRAYTYMDEVALIWNRYSGELLRVKETALYELVKALGGWI